VIGVVSQPDRPQGRGQKLHPTPVKQLAQQHQIPVWQPQRLRKSAETLQELTDLKADVFVVVAYGQILSQQVLDMPRLGCVNVHGSLLPAYRGAAPIQWAIARGERETGITTMLMDAGLDTGAMLLKASVPILPEQTGVELAEILAPLGAQLLIDTLVQWHQLTPIPQEDSLSSYAPPLKKEDFWLDWIHAAQDLHNQIRAFSPQCLTGWSGDRLKIVRSQFPHPVDLDSAHRRQSEPGQIVELIKGKGFTVQTGTQPLLITQVQPAGKKIQSAWDFVNGSRLQPDERLSLESLQ
jgi:methionyl-tRNA formyltransferase